MKVADTNEDGTISRRDFVKSASIAATAVATGFSLDPAYSHAATTAAPAPPEKPMIGFQAEVPYVLKYGIAPFLDDIQNRASVNTLILRCEPFFPSWYGIDKATSPLGNCVAAHPEYYRNVGMPVHGLNPGDFSLPDAMQKITAETKKRGIKIIPWMEEDNRARPPIKGMDALYEIDLHGQRTSNHPGGPCLNNPYYRNLITSQIEDFIRSYDVDGLQRGSERQGPFGNALGAWHHGSKSDPGRTSCFCEYCAAKAAKQGIDFERVKQGFLALEPYVKNGREGKRPLDGYYVEFWRILLRHPELLTWETFWADSMREMQRDFSVKAKTIKPGIQVGYHIWHNISFNPIYRAEQDYRPYTEFADFIKPVVYDNPAAERMTSFVYSVGQNMFGDLSRQQLLDFEYSVMGFKERSYDQIIERPESVYEAQLRGLPINGTPPGPFERFSGDYVYQETKRAVDGVAGTKTKVCAGLGIDVQLKNSTPESVRDAVQASFKAGASGIVISTSHAAMKPENLSAAGATLRELKLV
jgi:hypothetical protein